MFRGCSIDRGSGRSPLSSISTRSSGLQSDFGFFIYKFDEESHESIIRSGRGRQSDANDASALLKRFSYFLVIISIQNVKFIR